MQMILILNEVKYKIQSNWNCKINNKVAVLTILNFLKNFLLLLQINKSAKKYKMLDKVNCIYF